MAPPGKITGFISQRLKPGIVNPTKNFHAFRLSPHLSPHLSNLITSFAYMEPHPERRFRNLTCLLREPSSPCSPRSSHLHTQPLEATETTRFLHSIKNFFADSQGAKDFDIGYIQYNNLVWSSSCHKPVVAWAEPLLTLTASTVSTLQSSPPRTWRSLLVYENVVTSSTTLGVCRMSEAW